MANALAHHKSTVPADTSTMTADQIDLIKRTICKGADDDELRLFLYQCNRTGLDPLARQVYAIKRWDASQRKEVMAIQTSIDGFRLIAERTGKYAGQIGPFWCGADGQWQDVWVSDEPPVAAKVGVLRHDFTEPLWGVAKFGSYAQHTKDGKLTRMWQSMSDLMIAKCAEALALRRAFPHELSGLYTADEMAQAENGNLAKPKSAHAARKEGVGFGEDKGVDWAKIEAFIDTADYRKLETARARVVENAGVWPPSWVDSANERIEQRQAELDAARDEREAIQAAE